MSIIARVNNSITILISFPGLSGNLSAFAVLTSNARRVRSNIFQIGIIFMSCNCVSGFRRRISATGKFTPGRVYKPRNSRRAAHSRALAAYIYSSTTYNPM